MELNFTKMHGLGNDFVFVDDFNKSIELSADQIACAIGILALGRTV